MADLDEAANGVPFPHMKPGKVPNKTLSICKVNFKKMSFNGFDSSCLSGMPGSNNDDWFIFVKFPFSGWRKGGCSHNRMFGCTEQGRKVEGHGNVAR